jgi:hypothetical protein
MLTLIAFTSLASAANVTDMPSNLRGDVSLSYEYSQQWSELVEASEPVGGVNESSSQMTFEGEFAVHEWVSLTLSLPMWIGHDISWTDPRTMAWDPTEDVGSMRYGTAIEDGVEPRSGSGLGGASFGLRVSPISETRGAKASWVMGLSQRLKDDSNIFTGSSEELGGGQGAGATSITNAFSTTFGDSTPYIVVRWDRRGDHTASGIDPETGEASLINMSSGDSASFVSGIEFISKSFADGQGWFKTDVWGGARYNAWSEVPSGTYLPDVLAGTGGSTVVSSEYVDYTLGLGGHWRALPTMQVDMSVEFSVNSPIQLESAYPIYTGAFSPKITGGIKATFFYQ